jgi:hypothetical protein
METMTMRSRLNITFVRTSTLSFLAIILFYCKECTTITNTAERYHEADGIILGLKDGNMQSHNKTCCWIMQFLTHAKKKTVSPTEISSFCQNIRLYSGQICWCCWRIKLRKVSLRYPRLWSSRNPASCSKLRLQEKNERKRREACCGWAAP